MAVGQLRSKHRGLFAVLAYIVIGWILGALFLILMNAGGKTLYFEAADKMGEVM